MLMMILVSVKQFHSSKMQKTSIPKQGVMSDNMFHYADVPLSVIDNLINFEEELQAIETWFKI